MLKFINFNALSIVGVFLFLEFAVFSLLDDVLRNPGKEEDVLNISSELKQVSIYKKFVNKDEMFKKFKLIPEIVYLDLSNKTLYINDRYKASSELNQLIETEINYYSLSSKLGNLVNKIIENEFILKVSGLILSFLGYSVFNNLDVAAIGLLLISFKSIITSIPKIFLQYKFIAKKDDKNKDKKNKFNIVCALRYFNDLVFDYSLYIAFISGNILSKIAIFCMIGYMYKRDFNKDVKVAVEALKTKVSK